eukprot:jgi/Botrbrau1/6030/Bobra.0042s0015.1
MADRSLFAGSILNASSGSGLVDLGAILAEALVPVAWETSSRSRVYESLTEERVVTGVRKATGDPSVPAGVPSVPGAGLTAAVVKQRRHWIKTMAAKLSVQYLASVRADLKVQARFCEATGGQAAASLATNQGDLFANSVVSDPSKRPIGLQGSHAREVEEQQMLLHCALAHGASGDQSERCLSEATASAPSCNLLNTWSLRFTDSAAERSFVASQNRSQISVDQLMFIIMLFWYFVFPLLKLSGEGRVCPSPALWGHGLAIAIPSLLSIFAESSYAEWREVLLAGLSFMPLPGVPGTAAVLMHLLAQAFVIFRETLGFQVRFAVWAPVRTLLLAAFLLLEFPAALAALPWAVGSKLALALVFVTWAHVIPLAVSWYGEHAGRRKYAASRA